MRNEGSSFAANIYFAVSCHHNPQPINLNPEPNLCFPTFAIWYNGFGPGQCLFTGEVNSISPEI